MLRYWDVPGLHVWRSAAPVAAPVAQHPRQDRARAARALAARDDSDDEGPPPLEDVDSGAAPPPRLGPPAAPRAVPDAGAAANDVPALPRHDRGAAGDVRAADEARDVAAMLLALVPYLAPATPRDAQTHLASVDDAGLLLLQLITSWDGTYASPALLRVLLDHVEALVRPVLVHAVDDSAARSVASSAWPRDPPYARVACALADVYTFLEAHAPRGARRAALKKLAFYLRGVCADGAADPRGLADDVARARAALDREHDEHARHEQVAHAHDMVSTMAPIPTRTTPSARISVLPS